MRQFCYFLLWIVVVLSDATTIGDAENESNLSLVDQLAQSYLKEEDHLWAVIEKREDSTLQQIHDVHMNFLKRNYGESKILLSHSHLLANSHKILSNIKAINETSYDITHEFFGHPNYTVLSMKALNGINLDKTFQSIYELTVNSTEFWSNVKNSSSECQLQSRSVQSELQTLFEYYKDIQAASLRTYITAQLSYMMLYLHESGEYRNQSIAYQERFRQISEQVRAAFRNRLQSANREVRTCDPLDYNAPGVTYEITNFLQGYIDAEVNLNAEGSCALTCSDYPNTKHYACNSDTLCAGLKPANRSSIGCKGRVRACHGLDDSISVCPAADHSVGGRYKYVTSSTGLKLGNVTTCPNELQANAWVRWFVKCSNCFCWCDDPTNSERFFSLRPVVSDIEKNQIVTGVALTKRNGMIQFMIAERELTEFGTVNGTHIEYAWKLAEQFVPNDNNSRAGIDYHTLTYENRSINLDLIIGPDGLVVTGVRFKTNSKGHLQLEVRFTEFDHATGKLVNLDRSYWQSNESGGKHHINTDNLDIPTKSTKQSIPIIKENAYVRFGPTSKKADLSQTTVPFIDGQKIEPKLPAPLSGIGLEYRDKKPGYAGFIAPKINLYNFNSFIH